MNTGFLGPAVATVLTVYGIETNGPSPFWDKHFRSCNSTYRLRYWNLHWTAGRYGQFWELQQYLPFTVLKRKQTSHFYILLYIKLQQYLPFTVLKLLNISALWDISIKLQQYLPFTVLKRRLLCTSSWSISSRVATVLTVYGIETLVLAPY